MAGFCAWGMKRAFGAPPPMFIPAIASWIWPMPCWGIPRPPGIPTAAGGPAGALELMLIIRSPSSGRNGMGLPPCGGPPGPCMPPAARGMKGTASLGMLGTLELRGMKGWALALAPICCVPPGPPGTNGWALALPPPGCCIPGPIIPPPRPCCCIWGPPGHPPMGMPPPGPCICIPPTAARCAAAIAAGMNSWGTPPGIPHCWPYPGCGGPLMSRSFRRPRLVVQMPRKELGGLPSTTPRSGMEPRRPRVLRASRARRPGGRGVGGSGGLRARSNGEGYLRCENER
mmetsp:Transcript_49340/g.157993  ORF Transcript_49340/g.157993 Transcript_49340/m.157993 type:complete len:286 (-) Transcript_49340:65-922(-)